MKLLIAAAMLCVLPLHVTQEEREYPPIGGIGWVPGLPLEKEEKYEYVVQVHFLVKDQEAKKYPTTYLAFLHATSVWGKYLPVVFHFHTDSEFSDFFVMIPPLMIELNLGPVEDSLNLSEFHLGVWNGTKNRLYLDDQLETDYMRAIAVAMHEMGHMFGLRHITGSIDNIAGITGDITVDGSAVNYLMFPFEVQSNKYRWKPSAIEIRMAKNFIFNHLGSSACVHCNCLKR